jgi:hypothetical protein
MMITSLVLKMALFVTGAMRTSNSEQGAVRYYMAFQTEPEFLEHEVRISLFGYAVLGRRKNKTDIFIKRGRRNVM